MHLLFKDNIIGYINNIYQEQCWIYGDFEGSDKYREYREFFKTIVCEEGFDESDFDCELFVDTNWMVEDNGALLGIFIPAIYDDGEISFRYR